MSDLRQWCETCQAATASYICPTCDHTNCSQCESQCQTAWCLPDDELDRRWREAEWRKRCAS